MLELTVLDLYDVGRPLVYAHACWSFPDVSLDLENKHIHWKKLWDILLVSLIPVELLYLWL